MNLAAIVVTYNRLEKLKTTVSRTLAESALNTLIVVDNASTDGTPAWLDSLEDSRLQIVRSQKNQGGAGGFMLGMQAALVHPEIDWLVLYDDDAYPQSGAFHAFSECVKKGGFDAGAAAVYYPDGEICEMNRPSWDPFRHPKKLLSTALGVLGIGDSRQSFHIDDACYYENTACAIDSSSFVGFFVSRLWVEKLPALDGRLFIYGDDILYSLGLTKAGGRHLFLPDVRFTHDCSTFSEKTRKYYSPLWKAYFTYRNGLILYRFTAGKWFHLVWPLKALQWWLARRHYSDKRLYQRLVKQALRDGLRQDLSADPEKMINLYQER